MGWLLSDSVEEYANAALTFLRERPAEHTVPLTVVENLSAGYSSPQTPLFGWWADGSGRVQGACMHTPPYNLLLTDLPGEATDALAAELHRRQWSLPGVLSYPDVASRFASTWARLTGTTASTQREERLYRLAGLKAPDPLPPGDPRRTTPDDRMLLTHWFEAFCREAGAIAGDIPSTIDDRLSYGGLMLWEAGGVPVAFAGRSRSAAGVARIAPVYTPTDHRRRGYGAAVTAEACRTALDAGVSEVVLFTDRANPTSNSVYQRIGFRPLSDRLVLSFDRGG